MKIWYLAAILMFFGCDCNNQNNQVQDEAVEENSSGITYGPKMDFKPAFNIQKGEVEIGPSLDFGPRLNF